MKATELRIGNLVYSTSHKVFTKIIRLDFDSELLNIEPILLTEEWLVKFGFEEYKFEDEVFGYVLNDFGYIDEYQFRIRNFIDFEGIIIPKAIKTVHQLQNLYFALTGEELSL